MRISTPLATESTCQGSGRAVAVTRTPEADLDRIAALIVRIAGGKLADDAAADRVALGVDDDRLGDGDRGIAVDRDVAVEVAQLLVGGGPSRERRRPARASAPEQRVRQIFMPVIPHHSRRHHPRPRRRLRRRGEPAARRSGRAGRSGRERRSRTRTRPGGDRHQRRRARRHGRSPTRTTPRAGVGANPAAWTWDGVAAALSMPASARCRAKRSLQA